MDKRNSPRTDGTDGRDGRKNPSCPQDNPHPGDIPSWVRVLTAEIVGHNVQGVVLRRFGNRTEICFALKDGAKYDQPTRCDMAVAWMIENRVLARDDFFARCSVAKNSAALHHQALKRLQNMNLIERLSWGWVWK